MHEACARLAVLWLACAIVACGTTSEAYVPDAADLSGSHRERYRLATEAASRGRRDRAITLLQKVVATAPGHVPSRLLLQDLLLQRDGPTIVRGRAERLAEQSPHDWIVELLAVRLEADPLVRLERYRDLARREPERAWIRLAVADAAVAVSIRLDEEVREARRRGTIVDRQGLAERESERDQRLAEARNEIGRALARTPDLLPAVRRRGDILGLEAEREKNPERRRLLAERRLATYDEALRLDAADIPTLVARASVHRQRNDYAAADRDLARALAIRSWDPDLHQNRGVVAYEAGRFDLAESSFRRAAQLEPRSVEILRNLGDTLAARERWSEAEGIYRRALGHAPESPALLERLGNLRLRQEDPEGALEFYRRYLATDAPDRARVEAAVRRATGGGSR